MIDSTIIREIGFTEEDIRKYYAFDDVLGEKIEPFSKRYMAGEVSLTDVLKEIREIERGDISEYTVDLIFILRSTGYAWEKYQEKGVSREIFVNTMKDIKYKLDECISYKKIFGIFVAEWYNGFLEATRFGMGRLQFDIMEHSGDPITVGGYTLKEGEFKVSCHIPSSGKLTYDLCIDSYRRVYDAYKDKLTDGLLFIECISWLLYSGYDDVFADTLNVADFRKDYALFGEDEVDTFGDAWRVFSMDYDNNVDELPSKTKMQRNFIEHIKKGKKFGYGKGMIVFDGENILTRK